MPINLFLDDERNPCDVTWISLPNVKWKVVRNFDEFSDAVTHNEIEMISFDHDLGVGKTGKDCANFLIGFCLDRNAPLPTFFVHSKNGPGTENILSALQGYSKFHAQQNEAMVTQ